MEDPAQTRRGFLRDFDLGTFLWRLIRPRPVASAGDAAGQLENEPQSGPRRRFRLRTLLAVTAVVCVVLACIRKELASHPLMVLATLCIMTGIHFLRLFVSRAMDHLIGDPVDALIRRVFLGKNRDDPQEPPTSKGPQT